MGQTPRRGSASRGPANQLTQPVIPENNTCVEDMDSVVDRYATFDLKRGRTYRLRLINAGASFVSFPLKLFSTHSSCSVCLAQRVKRLDLKSDNPIESASRAEENFRMFKLHSTHR